MNKQTIKKYLVYAVLCVFFLLSLWFIFSPSESELEKLAEGQGINSHMPDPTENGIIMDKREAYDKELHREKQEERMKSLQELAFLLGEESKVADPVLSPESEMTGPDDYLSALPKHSSPSSGSGGRTNQSPVQKSVASYQDINRQLGSFYESPRQTNSGNEDLLKKIEELEGKLSEKNNRDQVLDEQLYLMEKSYEMAARYMPQTTSPQTPPDMVQIENNLSSNQQMTEKSSIHTIHPIQNEIVSALVQSMTNEELFRQLSQPRNFNFNTLETWIENAERNTINAIIQGDQTIIDGQSVRLPITEPLTVSGKVIPENTIITGNAKISGERLNIQISTLESQGSIIKVEINVYDSDGQSGIYIPGSMELDAMKEIAANMGSGLNSSINISQQNAGEQLLTDMGRSLLSGTSQYVSKKSKTG